MWWSPFTVLVGGDTGSLPATVAVVGVGVAGWNTYRLCWFGRLSETGWLRLVGAVAHCWVLRNTCPAVVLVPFLAWSAGVLTWGRCGGVWCLWVRIGVDAVSGGVVVC
jgi:hypothetical protein